MSRGKRYDGEQKLNWKKVFAVVIAIAVIIMFVVGIKKLMTPTSKGEEKVVAQKLVHMRISRCIVMGPGAMLIVLPRR